MNDVVTATEVERLAALIDLPLESEALAVVAEHLTGLLAAARLFADFSVPEDVPPAPIYRP